MNLQRITHLLRLGDPMARRHIVCLLLGAVALPSDSAVLDLVRAAPEGSWLKANQNAVSTVWTPLELRDPVAQSGLDRIIYAWGSFAWDSSRSNLIVYGGGHANYAGNDVYLWNGSSLLWERAALPSDIVPTNINGYTYGYPADGPFNAPPAAHTYDNTVYLKVADRYVTFGGAAWNTGGSYLRSDGAGGVVRTGPYLFDPSKADSNKVGGTTGSGVNSTTLGGQMWENRDSWVTSPSPVKPTSFVDGFSASTIVDGKDVIYVGASLGGTSKELFRYTINSFDNPQLDTWERVGVASIPYSKGNTSAALDPIRNILVRTGETGIAFSFWDLDTAGSTNADMLITPVDLTGGLMPPDMQGYGLIYDPVREQFVFWNGGPNVFSLTPPAGETLDGSGWTVDTLDLNSSSAPGSLDTLHILGKWQYADDLDAFVGLQGPYTGDVWIYKPEGWSDPAMLVPELETYAMFLVGLLVVALRVRRTRS